MNPPPVALQSDYSIQIGDGLKPQEPSSLTYKDDKFGNAIKTATLIAEDEAIRPGLDVGAEMLPIHRRLLRDLLCHPEPSPSPNKSGNQNP